MFARLLSEPNRWLLNSVYPIFGAPIYFWTGALEQQPEFFGWTGPVSGPFPYGFDVAPDHP